MQILTTRTSLITDILKKLRAERSKSEDVENIVKPILDDVKNNGDKALFQYTKKFDGADLNNLAVTKKEILDAYKKIDKKVINALQKAKLNIEKFHKQNIKKTEKKVETMPGVKVWREFRAIDRVGLYVPGGKAAYPSTVLMLGIPAQVAGCTEVIMCTPADRQGKCNPAVLVASDICKIKKIYKVGGAQAIAALAYGTETIPKTYKIFGPGNQFVTTAKMLVYGEAAIDMPAGPSEVLIIADETANPEWIAADLLSQLEHGEDSQGVLVTTSKKFANDVIQAMAEQKRKLTRKTIIEKSSQRSFVVVVKSLEEAVLVSNEYAPEHLEIDINDPYSIIAQINNAGSVFLGKYTSEPLGDYATGANHTLPTSGYAKMFPPLSTESFGKMMQVQEVSKQGLENLRDTVETIAESEGLDAHKNAISIRFNN